MICAVNSRTTLLTSLALLAAAMACAAAEAPVLPPVPIATAEQAAQVDELAEIVVVAPEPRYVAPTRRDRIGRVWVPVYVNEQGPFRLVLDSGATSSAVIASVAQALRLPTDRSPPVLMRGVTGSAVVPTIHVDSITVGDLLVGRSRLPIVADAFGGAE
jgi:predicted aspartyl protease